MTRSKATELLHEVVLNVWLRKESNRVHVHYDDFTKHINAVQKRKNLLWVIGAIAVCTYLCLVVFGFLWMNYFHEHHLATTVGNMALYVGVCALLGLIFLWTIQLLLTWEVKAPNEIVRSIALDYFKLRSQLSEVDLWGEYVKTGLRKGSLEGNLKSWAVSAKEFFPSTLVHETGVSLRRIAQEVLSYRRISRRKGVRHEQRKFAPAFALAYEVYVLPLHASYQGYLPTDSD